MPGSLKLILDSFSVDLIRFAENGYERIFAQTGDTTYSLLGTAIDDGGHHEPKHLWTIGAVCTQEQWQIINAIFQRQERNRRNQQDYSILIHDTIQYYNEDIPIASRQPVPLSQLQLIPGGGVRYFAQFKARMFEPTATIGSNQKFPYSVRFVLKETDRVSAP
jgi:hypothetical protein